MFSERKIWNDGAPFEDFMGRDEAPPVARRHLAFGGGKGGAGGTTYQQQTTTIPPEVRARYDAVNARAETAAQQPFQPYTGQFVSPLTATQQAGIGQIAAAGQGYQPYQQAATTALTGAAEAALPYYGQAGQNIDAAQAAGAPYTSAATMAGMAGAQAVNPGQLQIGQYMDPYLQSVVAPTMQGLYQQQQQQQSQLMGSQAMRGAFGGDRGSIAAANLARQQGLAAQQAQGGLLSQGYGQALQAAQQQQGVGLQAGQANRAAMQQLSPQLLQIGQQAFQQPMAAAQAQQGLGQGLLGYGQNVAQGLSGLGQQGTQTGLASGQALLGAGTLEQQTQQQLNAALQNQYQQQQGYPFQIAQFLANIAYGGGPLYGSTTSGVTGSPTPFFSDERVKEDITEIGRTHDGQKIIKFKYKGSNQPQIGLSAQDVEKHHPEAVSEFKGIKAVDYDAATKHAERAYGGGLMPSSEGGAVHPSMAGLGFAAGGSTPGVDEYSQQLLQSLVNPHAGSLPYGTAGKNMPAGKQQGWSVKPMPAATLLKGTLPPPPPPPKSSGEVVGGGIKDAVGAVETGEKAYKFGEKAYDWARKQAVGEAARPAVPAAGNTPAQPAAPATSGNLGLGHGGKWGASPPAQPQTSAAPGLGAAEPPPQQTAEAATNLNPPEITTASLEELPTEDLGGLGSAFVARGGRIGYEGGGLVGSNPALPYTGGDDNKSIVEDLADDPQKQNKLDAPKLDMSDSAGGGKKDTTAKDALGLAGTLAKFIPMFVKNGGRIGYAEGGGQTFVDRLMPAALKASEKTGVHPHLILAQAALESGWGKHAPGNNYFGIKGPGQVLDTKEQGATGLYNTRDSFRKYESPEHSVDDYANFIMTNSRYRPVREARTLDEQIEAMGRSGYATDKDYTAKLRSIANNLSGNATPFTPSERGHETPTAPPQRSAGLAPPLHDVEDMHEGLEPIDTGDDFEMPDRFEMPNRFASGGLVPRHGYQTAGSVPRLDYQTASEEGVPSGASEEDLQRELQRGLREEPFARSTGLGGLNLPQHQLPALGTEGSPTSISIPPRSVPPAERTRDDRDLSGYNPPGSVPAAAPAPVSATPQASGATTPAPQATGAATPAVGTGVAPPLKSADTPPPKREDISLANDPRLADRNFFDRAGDWLGKNQNWLLPVVSGVGKMLASPSPYLGVAIGQGLAEGAQTGLGASFKQQGLDIQQQNADIAAARQLYGVYTDLGARIANSQGVPGVDLDPLQKQYQNLSRQINRLIGKYVKSPEEAAELLTGGGSGGGAPTAAPASGAPTAAPGGGPPTPVGGQPAPASDQSDIPMWARRAQTTDQQRALIKQNIDPMQDPDVLRQRAAQAAQTDPNGQIVKDLLEKANRIQTTMLDVGKVPTKNGVMTLPGWSDARSEVERVDDNTRWRNTYEPRQTQHTSQLATIDELTRALQEVQSGPAAGTINKYTSLIAQLAGVDVRTMLSNPEAYYKARKDAYKLINDSFGSSGTRTDMQLGTQIDASANPDLPPNTNKAIIAQLKAKAEWTKERDKWLYDQMQRYGAHIDRGGAAQEWGAKNEADLIKRIGETYKNTAVLGDINDALDRQGKPIPSKLTEGQMYMVPVGNGQFKQARYMGLNPQTGKTRWE